MQRSKLFYFGILLIFSFLVGRLFYLQMVSGADFREYAEDNRLSVERQKAPRGLIFGRNGEVLVENVPMYNVSIVLSELRNRSYVLQRLAEILNINKQEIEDIIYKNRFNRYRHIKIYNNASIEQISQIEEQCLDFPGVYVDVASRRHYLVPGHFFGYVGELSENEIKKLTNTELPDGVSYSYNDVIGRAGLEMQYESILKGKDGFQLMEVNAKGKRIRLISDAKNEVAPGADMYLTIDERLQKKAVEAMEKVERGAIVAIAPKTGEILAYLSKPYYDINDFSVGISAKLWNRLLHDPNKPLLDRNTQGLYPPASTFKLFTAAFALEKKMISEHTLSKHACVGGMRFGNRFFRCWKRSGHGRPNVIDGIRESCDVFFYSLATELDLDEFYQFILHSGLINLTNIDIPGEKKGSFPNSNWYNRNYGKRNWTRGNYLNLSIGQGEVLVTPLELATAYCQIANRGYYAEPHFLRSYYDYKTSTWNYFTPQKHAVNWSESTYDILHEGLRQVVNVPSGTAYWYARLPNVTVGGKTGTAQNPHGEDHAWFAAVAPMEAPEIVIVAFVEEGLHGSSGAAPLTRVLLETYFSQCRADSLQSAQACQAQ